MSAGELRTDVERLSALIASGRVHDGAAIASDVSDRAQVCVVGTGAGGGAIAYELVRGGHSVVLIEEGAYWTGRDLTGEPASMRARLYREAGAARTRGGPRMALPLGCCVGGATMIGSGALERADPAALEAWAEEPGLAGLARGELEPYYERVERELGVAPVPDAALGVASALLERGAGRLGWPSERVRRAAPGCLATGVCAYGCPQDAKQSMAVSYVPAALAAGAHLYTRARAERLLLSRDRVFGVSAELLDEAGRPTGRRLRVIADRVVVACGALLTPGLLSRSGLSRLSPALGRHLRLHPRLRLHALFDEEVRSWAGVPAAVCVRPFSDGTSIRPAAEPPATTAVAVPGIGADHKRLLESFSRIGSYEIGICEEAEGSVRLSRRGFPRVRAGLTDGDRRRLLRALGAAAEICFAAGARVVAPGLRRSLPLSDPGEARALAESDTRASEIELAAQHAIGTARMADSASRGVVGPAGEVFGVRDLYVADAGVLPSSCRADPQLTVMAIALRTGAGIAAGLGPPL